MKAVLLRGYGGVDQLEYTEVPTPEPGPGEVLVKVIATSVNPVDYKIRSGALREVIKIDLPTILGRDVAGEVTALGPGVTKFRPGDKVMGLVNHSYAEYVAARADVLTNIPEGLDPVQAGVLPLVVLTGAQLIENGVKPESGELVLVTGALGGVGRTAVYVAGQRGAKVIAGVKSSQKKDAESLGAASVAALDDDQALAGLPELDAIADTVNGDTVAKLIPKLKRSGRLVTVVGAPDAAKKAGVEVRDVWARPDPDRLNRLAEDVRDGKLKMPIARRMRLSEVREAHELAEQGVNGKIALLP